MAARSSGPRVEAMVPITVTPVWYRSTGPKASIAALSEQALRAWRQKSEPIESAAGKYIFLRMTDNTSKDSASVRPHLQHGAICPFGLHF